MASDNEIMVLIYETVQKQLGEIKNSRVVIQTLANRVSEIEKAVENIDKKTEDFGVRITNNEKTIKTLTETVDMELRSINKSDTKLTNTIDAMRSSLEKVVNPSITLVSNNTKELRDSVRVLKSTHTQVMDVFEGYELRILKLEDMIDKMLRKQLLNISDYYTEVKELDPPEINSEETNE